MTSRKTMAGRWWLLLTSNAWLLLMLAPLLWGGNAVAGKTAAAYWPPFTLTAARWLGAVLLLLPLALGPLARDWPVVRRSLPYLFVLGACGMAMFNLLLYLSLNYTSAINVSILQSSMPIFIMLANFLILGERASGMQITGLLLATFGVLVTTTAGNPMRFVQGGFQLGDLLILIGSVFYAAYSFGLRWRPEIHWMSFMFVIAVSALIASVPFAAWELGQGERVQLGSATTWLLLLYIAIFPTLLGQLAYARGVALIGSNRAGLFINLVPIFGSVLAVLLLGESFRWYHAVGLVLVLGGIMLSERVRFRP